MPIRQKTRRTDASWSTSSGCFQRTWMPSANSEFPRMSSLGTTRRRSYAMLHDAIQHTQRQRLLRPTPRHFLMISSRLFAGNVTHSFRPESVARPRPSGKRFTTN